MSMSSVLTKALRPVFSLRTIVILVLAAFITINIFAGDAFRAQESEKESQVSDDANALIDVVVADIQGTTALIEGGMSIELSGARVSSVAGEVLDLSAIKIGTRMRASLVVPADAASPFVAKFVQLRPDDEIVLVAPLQAVDIPNGSVTVLNRRFLFNGGTVFGFGPGFKKLKVGRIVTISAKPSGADLIATRVYLDDQKAEAGAGFF